MIKVILTEDTIEFKNEDGFPHNPYGPSYISLDSSFRMFHLNGKRHNLKGPAVIFANGDKTWYINGSWFSEEAFNIEIEKLRAPSS